MPFALRQTSEAAEQLDRLRNNKALQKRFKTVSKCLRLLANNPWHPGLQAHEYDSLKGENDQKVFEAYAENQTSGAYRVFWHYGPNQDEITIVAITPHP